MFQQKQTCYTIRTTITYDIVEWHSNWDSWAIYTLSVPPRMLDCTATILEGLCKMQTLLIQLWVHKLHCYGICKAGIWFCLFVMSFPASRKTSLDLSSVDKWKAQCNSSPGHGSVERQTKRNDHMCSEASTDCPHMTTKSHVDKRELSY